MVARTDGMVTKRAEKQVNTIDCEFILVVVLFSNLLIYISIFNLQLILTQEIWWNTLKMMKITNGENNTISGGILNATICYVTFNSFKSISFLKVKSSSIELRFVE